MILVHFEGEGTLLMVFKICMVSTTEYGFSLYFYEVISQDLTTAFIL